MFLIDAVRPKRTHAQMVDDLKMAVQDGVAKGLVGIHDAGVGRETVDFFERCVVLRMGRVEQGLIWARLQDG